MALHVKRPPVATAGASGLCSAAQQNDPANNTDGHRQQVVVVAPVDRCDRFSAHLEDGRLLVKTSRQPFLDAARVLLAEGADPHTTILMRHRGSDVNALRAQLGVAAGLTVREEDGRPPRFARWKPLHLGDGSARTAEEEAIATSMAEAAE